MQSATSEQSKLSFWDRPVLALIGLTWEKTLYLLLFIAAVASRFYNLGARVMSHDESLHTQFSWYFYVGRGFQHSPLMHGPSLFMATAVNYFLFGDSDFSARIFPAVMGIILALVIPWVLRPWLGRTGALATSFLFLISPAILYHSRYIRHDIPLLLFAMICFAGMMYYFERPKDKHLYWIAAGLSLMFTTMEASYIYSAIFLLFIALKVGPDVLNAKWDKPDLHPFFRYAVLATLIGGGLLVASIVRNNMGLPPADENTGQIPGLDPSALPVPRWLEGIFLVIVALGAVAMFVLMIVGVGSRLRKIPSFDVLIVVGTLVLPMLSAFVMRIGCQFPNAVLKCYQPDNGTWEYWSANWDGGLVILALYIIAATVGSLWDWKRWWIAFGVFYAIFIPLYTSLFTWGLGVLTGVVGGLGYWLVQQGVQRGGQPPYYYLWLWPFYEFTVILLALGTIIYLLVRGRGTSWYDKLLLLPGIGLALSPLLAVVMGAPAMRRVTERAVRDDGTPEFSEGTRADDDEDEDEDDEDEVEAEEVELDESGTPKVKAKAKPLAKPVSAPRNSGFVPSPLPRFAGAPVPATFVTFTAFWMWMSIAAYSAAGEKMPWLITHLTGPTILLAGWGLGRLLDGVQWGELWRKGAWALFLLGPVFGLAAFRLIEMGLFGERPFQGQLSDQLNNTSNWMATLVIAVLAVAAIAWYTRGLRPGQVARSVGVVMVAGLCMLTMRTAWRDSYVKYDDAQEFMVYAHGAPATKQVLAQIEDLSMRLYGDKSIKVAYDDDVAWPFTWYLRDTQFPNATFYGAAMNSDIARDAPVILAGDKNWKSVEAFLGTNYDQFEYIFLWWPIEDYKNLNEERIKNVFTYQDATTGERSYLHALWDIWMYRDYKRYGELTKTDYSLGKWPVRHSFKLYVRKDVAARFWDYSTSGVEIVPPPPDACEQGRQRSVAATVLFNEGGLTTPRAVAVTVDGQVVVADTGNNRIVVYDATGKFVRTFGDATTLKEPWGVAVDAQSNIYVADTWNHRVVKFDINGTQLKTWGEGAYGGGPTADNVGKFWGPRGIAVGPDGRVYVTDTGNKRVEVFDGEGVFLGQFGTGGVVDGSMDEPVGVAVSAKSEIYVADTWNTRVDVFSTAGTTFTFARKWLVTGWQGQSLDNKPYIVVDDAGRTLVTDPERARVIVYNADGTPYACWGQPGGDPTSLGMPMGIAVDKDGNVYVADSTNGRVAKFPKP